jgi:hypothetical protein
VSFAALQDLAWERYYDLKPSELGDLIRMPKYGKALVSACVRHQTLCLTASGRVYTAEGGSNSSYCRPYSNRDALLLTT